jgi:hypothetical protein
MREVSHRGYFLRRNVSAMGYTLLLLAQEQRRPRW